MSAFFDSEELARQAGVSAEQCRELEACVRQQYGSDEMLAELRVLRTLHAIKRGVVSVASAVQEFRDAPIIVKLDAYLAGAQLANEEREQVRDFIRTQLSPDERKLVILYYYERMAFPELAGALHVSRAEVERMHSSIIERLRRSLDPSLVSRAFRVAS